MNNRLLTGSPSRDHIAGGYNDDSLPHINDINNKLFLKLKSRYYDHKTLITKYFNRVPMSMRRSLLVKVAFYKAHGEHNEYILIKDILKKFHPQVYDKQKQPIQSLHWFIQDFKDINNNDTNTTNNTTTNTTTNTNDNKIYFDQFEKYYKYLSCFIENDNVFEKIIVDIIKVDGEDTINFMKGVKVSYNGNDNDNDFNPTISYSELPNVNTTFTSSSPRPSSAQQSPANAKVKFSIPEEDDNDALSYFDHNNNSPLKGLNTNNNNNNNNNSKQPPESYYSNGNGSSSNNGNGNKSRSKQVGVSPLRSNKPPLAQPSLGTPQFIPKAPSQSSPRNNVPNIRMQSPNTYNNNSNNNNNNLMYSSMNSIIQAADFSPPKNPESISSGMIQQMHSMQEQMHSMQASFSLGVEEMNKLKEIEYQSQQEIIYYKSQLQASFNQNNDLHTQNEDLKKQNHKLTKQLKSVFSSYEALLALHEQTQQTLHQQNSVLKHHADEIKNLVNNTI